MFGLQANALLGWYTRRVHCADIQNAWHNFRLCKVGVGKERRENALSSDSILHASVGLQ